MSKFKRFMSLKHKLLIVMTIAVLASALVFLAVREFGNFLVWRYYLDEGTKQERAESYVEEFQEYVFENKLSIHDSKQISDWSAGSYVDIILYKDSALVYAPEWFVGVESEEETDESETVVSTDVETEAITENNTSQVHEEVYDTSIFDNGGWFSGDRGFEQYLTEEARDAYRETLDDLLSGNQELRPVYFVDGTLLIRVVDYTENFVYSLVNAVSLIAAFFLLAMVMIFNFTGTATRVNRLAHNVKLVESGNLEMPIVLDGNDELTALAADVNSMRNAVVDNMTKEKQAWEANSELITAMSHDIRTPLTVLLGYLDLMELQNSDESYAEYISSCKENALRLKRLSDDMFSYFLVFGKNDLTIDLSEEVDCSSLEHMLAEREVLLTELGFEVERTREVPNVTVRIDTMYFSRVIDNIFTNLSKYADPTECIRINSFFDGSYLTVTVKNRIKSDRNQSESNGIGIKTCVRIMELLGGRFEILNEDDYYTVFLKVAATPMEEKCDDIANS